jgi:hypothetical protein
MLTGKLIFHVLPRPWHWPALIRMGENSKKAARNIAGTLYNFLSEQDGNSNP